MYMYIYMCVYVYLHQASLEFSYKISMLGVTLGSDLSWNDHISTTAKAAWSLI